jgi:hypothetical protein
MNTQTITSPADASFSSIDHGDSAPENTLGGGNQSSPSDPALDATSPDTTLPPIVYLPGDITTIRESAIGLMEALSKTGLVFNFRNRVVTLDSAPGIPTKFVDLSKACLPSYAERHVKFRRKEWIKDGEEIRDLPRAFSQAHAGSILACKEAREVLPKITRLLSFPTVRDDGSLSPRGYDPHTGTFGIHDMDVPNIQTDRAVCLLLDLLGDWRWGSPSDQSRAVAALLAPMLRLGLFAGKSLVMPIFMVEADQSQSGKGMLVKLISAIYGKSVRLVSQRKGGVGSLDEEFNRALLEGGPLISLDNLRGRINSATLESFVTADGTFNVRALRSEGHVDSRDYVLYATSNAFEATQDLANRLCAIRILQQQEDYRWRNWEEGGLIAHVEANQATYLGAVAAVLRSWIEDGKPSLECVHRQREWAISMNWIVQRVFNLSPLTEGHDLLLQRVRNPVLGFLRELAIAMDGNDRKLTIAEIISEARVNGITVPVLNPGRNDSKAEQLHLGTQIQRLFDGRESLELEGWTIERTEVREQRADGEGYFNSKAYCFRKASRFTQ